ncbi:Protein arginine N-methyltransferase 1.6 [Linum grandiflorum]
MYHAPFHLSFFFFLFFTVMSFFRRTKTLAISTFPAQISPTRQSNSTLTRFNPTLARAMSTDSTQRVFQLKLDPLTGESQWVIIDDGEDQSFGNSNAAAGLLSTTSYLDMLNDSPRNRAFRQAIDKTVTKPCHVLDIGAGTGLLSMMAARAMGGGGKVTSCESYLPMAKLMRKVLHVNGMGKDIKVINKRSDELQMGVDIPSRADVLVSEILDSELLGEGLIPSLQHAYDELLVENALTVPYRATTYGQLVESSFFRKLHDLRNNETKIQDAIRLVPNGSDTIIQAKSRQLPLHCDALFKEIRLLSKPFEIFEFDFWRRPESHGEAKVLVEAIDDGRANGIVSWWILQLDREGTIFYSTAPKWIDQPVNTGASYWCDHWKQCVWLIPDEGVRVSKGNELIVHAFHDETSVSYNVASEGNDVSQYDSAAGDFHLLLPPERIAIHGDIKWRSAMSKAVRNALEGRVEPLCMVADDSIFLTLLAARLSETSRVVSLLPGLRDQGARYLETVAKANGITANRIEVVKDKKNIPLHCTNQKKVDLLIGEPFYHGSEGMLPWQNLRFWKDRTILDPFLAEDATILPCKALLKACAMSLPDLWNSRRSLAKIEGFEHSIANSTLGACGELPTGQEGPLLPFFIWQCGETKELGEAITVMEFDFRKPIASCRGKAEVRFMEPGICHGFVLWLDWVMDANESVVISTGPDERCWKQAVKLLSQPIPVGAQGRNSGGFSSSVIEAEFDELTCELAVKNDFC